MRIGDIAECEDCQGTGRVDAENVTVHDRGTKWQRTFVEHVNIECPTCNGSGLEEE